MESSGSNLPFVRSIAFFITSALGKLPFVYTMMLLWSGIVIGLTGQAVMFLAYIAVMLIAYGLVRPVLASTTNNESSGYLYSIIKPLGESQKLLTEYIGVFMGIPTGSVDALTGVNKNMSWGRKFLLIGLPDAMIFPSAFLYGYGIVSTQNGITDAKNMPMLFMTLLSILLQLNITQMGGVVAFLNVVIGVFLGVLSGSFVSDNPDLGPFTMQNQSFNVVVTNIS